MSDTSAWQELHGACEAANQVPALAQLLGATHIHRYPRLLGNLIAELCDANVRSKLADWSVDDSSAAQLDGLIDAFVRAELPRRIHPEITAKSSRVLFANGDLQRDYVLAAFASDLPGFDEEADAWFRTLRLWLLVRAIDGVGKRVFIDLNLKAACDGLRLALKGDRCRREALMRLRRRPATVAGLNNMVSNFARRERLIKGGRERLAAGKPWYPQLLDALRAVANGKVRLPKEAPTDDFLMGLLGIAQEQLPHSPAVRTPDTRVQMMVLAEDSVDTYVPPTDSNQTGVLILAATEPDVDDSEVAARTLIFRLGLALHHLPSAWTTLLEHEEIAVRQWIARAAVCPDSPKALVGAYLYVALEAGRTLHQVMHIAVSEVFGADWAWNAGMGKLHRQPPRRQGWTLDKPEEQRQWLIPDGDSQTLPLPHDIQHVLSAAFARHPQASTLGDLWRFSESVVGCTRSVLHTLNLRLSTTILACALGDHVFHATGDASLSALIASSPSTALPSAAGYGSWTAGQVQSALKRTTQIEITGQPGTNALGSRLHIRIEAVKQGIARASARVDVAHQSADLAAFHNHYVHFHVMALWAATGVRPIVDPFESVEHFDLEAGLAFVDDKHIDNAHAGRLVPLCAAIRRFLRQAYPAYLQRLAQLLEAADGSLAAAIRSMAVGKPNGTMPYFFELDSRQPRGWRSVTPAGIGRAGIFDWPLPENVFRHWMAISLRQRKLDPEIIDGLLGHAELGAATYGDDSVRIWRDDAREARYHMGRVFGELGFGVLGRWMPTDRHQTVASDKRLDSSGNAILNVVPTKDVLFGAANRAEQRHKRHREQLSQATETIRQYLEKNDCTKLASLEQPELDKLAWSLLFNPNGVPHAAARARYACLMRVLEREGSKTPSAKRRRLNLQAIDNPASPFTSRAAGALTLKARLLDLRTNLEARPNVGRPSRVDYAVRALLALTLDSAITDAELLMDVIAVRNVRLASAAGICWLEHAPGLKVADPDAVVRSFAIGKAALEPLNALLSAKASRVVPAVWAEPLPQHWQPLYQAIHVRAPTTKAATVADLALGLCRCIDQVNAMTVPGIIAGYRAGRVHASALRWRDRLRLLLDRRVALVGDTKVEPEAIDRQQIAEQSGVLRSDLHDFAQQAQAGLELYSALRERLLDEMPGGMSVRLSLARRKVMRQKMDAMVAQFCAQASPVAVAVSRWVSQASDQVQSRKIVAPSTQIRYLNALRPLFGSLGAGVDLVALDEDEQLALFQAVVDAGNREDTAYPLQVLTWFHAWYRQREPLASPNWAAIDAMGVATVAPAIVTEEDYQRALTLVAPPQDLNPLWRLDSAMFLLLMYRFALRESDAFGLAYQDWIDIDNQIWVLKRDHRWRKLKGSNGHRYIVPCVFELSDTEIRVIRDWFDQRRLTLEDSSSLEPFFEAMKDETQSRPHLARLKRIVTQALRQACANPLLSPHSLRHAAANRVALALTQAQVSQGWSTLTRADTPYRAAMRRSLLVREAPTRRALWACAGFMGHAGVRTLPRSYLHFLGPWSDALAQVNVSARLIKQAACVQQLEQFVDAAFVPSSAAAPPVRSTPRLRTIVSFLWVLSRGKDWHDAASLLDLDLEAVQASIELIERVGNKVRVHQPTSVDPKLPRGKRGRPLRRAPRDKLFHVNRPVGFAGMLQHLSATRWNSLLSDTAVEPVDAFPALKADDFLEMIGAQRQLLARTTAQLDWLKALFDVFRVDARCFDFVATAEAGPSLVDHADCLGWRKVVPSGDAQIDSLIVPQWKAYVPGRIAVRFGRGTIENVRARDGFEMVVAALSVQCWLMACKQAR